MKSTALKIAKERLIDIANSVHDLSNEQLKIIYDSLYSAAIDAITETQKQDNHREYEIKSEEEW